MALVNDVITETFDEGRFPDAGYTGNANANRISGVRCEQVEQFGGADFHLVDHTVYAAEVVVVEHEGRYGYEQPAGGGYECVTDTFGEIGRKLDADLVLSVRLKRFKLRDTEIPS